MANTKNLGAALAQGATQGQSKLAEMQQSVKEVLEDRKCKWVQEELSAVAAAVTLDLALPHLLESVMRLHPYQGPLMLVLAPKQ
ncbi:hypothetical protein E2562_031534 [Oryza meyeriana var. granulata]|uniref:Uncharacterized protein n=1 Tax=Oryza meyeriana var. granulata TaxID=110450 RepID=A0A6G1FED7_9ORYZ|nr:hypothetical protein E2562_031534 [Oryza meyeriana var. granulata]